ncbi:MAG: NUDIX domain-containing protein [Geodermatophilaceae bacterium]
MRTVARSSSGPWGGGIEFGETAEEALRREFTEELGVALGVVRLLGVLENRFELAGVPGHEIVFVFTAEESDWPEPIPPVVADSGEPVTWEPLDRFRSGADAVPDWPGSLNWISRTPASIALL